MTYTVCKRLIENKDFTVEEKSDMELKLDIFLLHNRINEVEYEELIGLMNED